MTQRIQSMFAGLLSLLSHWAGAAVAATPNLSVSFVHPEHYTDASYTHARPNAADQAAVQRDLEQHLQRLADRGLSPGAALKIEVLDIDLAGEFEPLRTRDDIRVMRDITWPRITLRYTLTQGDQVVTSREEQVSDMNYLRSSRLRSGSDRLGYEKAMLDDWFERRIVRH